MFVNFTEKTRHLLKQAENEKEELNHPYVGSEHLLLSILKDNYMNDVFIRNKLDYNKFKEKLIAIIGVGSKKAQYIFYTPLLKRVIENAVIDSKEYNNKVTPELLIIELLNEKDGIAYSVLKNLNINVDKLLKDIRLNTKKIKKKKLYVEEIGVDLIKMAKEKKIDPVIGRNKEIEQTIQILLRRKKNNPILIGPAGVGKTAIVEGIANIMIKDSCPKYLKNKKLISINIFQLVSGTKYRGEFEDKMKRIIKELEVNSNIILFIDEIHTLVGAGGAEGAIDASNILKPALARGNIRIIGATTIDEYKKNIEPDAALARRFQKILVNEPSEKEVLNILYNIKPIYEKFHNIIVPNSVIKDIVYLSNKFIFNRYNPDKSIDILDEVSTRVAFCEDNTEKEKEALLKELKNKKELKLVTINKKDFNTALNIKKDEIKIIEKLKHFKNNKKVVTKEDVVEVIKQKSNNKLLNTNKEFYLKLSKELKTRIYGQDELIDKLIKSLYKKRMVDNKCFSVLLKGDKHTGKKYIAEVFLNSLLNKDNIFYINGNDYSDKSSISKLIGTTIGYVGYDNKENIFESIKLNPNSGFIINNYCNGCKEFKELFHRIIKNNYIEDAKGNKINFSCCYIFIVEDIKQKSNLGFTKYNSIENNNSTYSLEISTNHLDKENTSKIIDVEIKKYRNKYNNINIIFEESYIKYLYESIYKNGLNKLEQTLEKDIENKIINAIFNNVDKIIINKESIIKS